jgi:hypothetical protein
MLAMVSDDSDVDLSPVLLGVAATSIFIQTSAALLAMDAFAGFMLLEHVGKELLVGGGIRVGVAASLHDVADPLAGGTVGTVFMVRVHESSPGRPEPPRTNPPPRTDAGIRILVYSIYDYYTQRTAIVH